MRTMTSGADIKDLCSKAKRWIMKTKKQKRHSPKWRATWTKGGRENEKRSSRKSRTGSRKRGRAV